MNLYVLKASGRLTAFEEEITSAFNEVVRKIEGKMALSDIDVVALDNPDPVIPETGMVGYAVTANLIYINIDPNSLHFKNHVREEILSTLTHELHHCGRINTIGYGKTLIEAMVTEGLADHFDMEINGTDPRPWSVALTEAQLEVILKKASVEFDNSNYNHGDWFFGSEEKEIPRWTGYSLGFEIIKKYMEKSGMTAAELVSTQAQSFIQ